jgi:UDP-N-acetylglucosamine--N-acetylmuramyl-(pentapeptide) pyrophosphoryl-undecaprenol N-acetylglucosamine transferase
MKILCIGGHLTPALATLDYLQHHHPQVELVFVGRRYSQVKLKQEAIEQKQMQQRGIPFIAFSAVKLGRAAWWRRIFVKPLKFALSLYQAWRILQQTQPDLVLSFGGYMAVPLALAAKLRTTTLLTHEGTRVMGLANQVIARLADQVAITYAEMTSEKIMRPLAHKVMVTGNPVRSQVLPGGAQCEVSPSSWLERFLQVNQNQPLLLVLGGNQGSLAINQAVADNLDWLLAEWAVVHACGRANQISNYQEELQAAVQQLSSAKQQRYAVKPWIEVQDLGCLYQQADGAVSRAGANTVLELSLNQVPTIFIPLPYAHLDEQLKNARYLQQRQAALILPQDQLNTARLQQKLKELKDKRDQLKKHLAQLSWKEQGARNLAELALSLAQD